MTWSALALAAGLVVLLKSADVFVGAASELARRWGMSPLWVGMVVVGFGTSLPELLVSLLAALDGEGAVALGNVVGSNIGNIGLILGLSALAFPLALRRRSFGILLAFLLASTALFLVLMRDGVLGRGDAALLLVLFGVQFWLALRLDEGAPASVVEPGVAAGAAVAAPDASPRALGDAHGAPGPGELGTGTHLVAANAPGAASAGALTLRLLLGLGLLAGGSKLFVWGAVGLAGALGVSELVIGLTVVALGTSLPELATSFSAARRGEGALVLGNVIGSNGFNLLGVLGVSGLVGPLQSDVTFDGWVLMGFTLALLVVGLVGPAAQLSGAPGQDARGGLVSRLEGGLLLAAFFGYVTWRVLAT